MEADTQMDLGQINGVYGEVGGLPTPVAAHVSEEQLPELRIYTVSAGELLETVSAKLFTQTCTSLNITACIRNSTR